VHTGNDHSFFHWILPEVFIGNRVLVEEDDNATLRSFAGYPVIITALHVVCNGVRGWIAVVTDEWSAVTVLTGQVGNAQDNSLSSHYVELYPRNRGVRDRRPTRDSWSRDSYVFCGQSVSRSLHR